MYRLKQIFTCLWCMCVSVEDHFVESQPLYGFGLIYSDYYYSAMESHNEFTNDAENHYITFGKYNNLHYSQW